MAVLNPDPSPATPPSDPALPRFLRTWLVGLVALLCAVLALNIAVDPYGILGTPAVRGLTADKPAAADRPRMTKAYLVDRAGARTLLLGASNVDVGLDPTSPAWPAAARPVFNLAIDGSLPNVLYRYLQHALVRNQPKQIFVGMAFEDTMIMPAKRLGAADEALYSFSQRLRLSADGTPNAGYLAARLEDTVFATLSIQALTDSVQTLLRQGDDQRNRQTAMGHNTGGNFIRWTDAEGAYALVMAKDQEKAPQFLIWAAEPRLDVKPLGDIVRLARAHGAEVTFFIQPSYVDELELIRQSGLMPAWNAWKTAIVDTLQAAGGDRPVPLWDFSGYNRYTTEALPPSGDIRHQLSWFWEPIHYRAALGELLIRRLTGSGEPADLGVTVTPATLAAHLAGTEAAQLAWVAAHPQDVERLTHVVEVAASMVCHGPLTQCPRAAATTIATR